MKQANGWYIDDMIVFRELDCRGWISKGFKIVSGDYRTAKNISLNDLHYSINIFLKTLSPDIRAQFQWSVDSNYENELKVYDQATEKFASNEWTNFVRKERFNRYWRLMKDQKLRREYLKVYISTPINGKTPLNKTKSELDDFYVKILKSYERFFQQKLSHLQTIFSIGGISIIPMTDNDHYLDCAKFLNPSFANRNDFEPLDLFRQEDSIQQNCWHSGFKGNNKRGMDNEYAFYMDGHYHDVICLKRMPEATSPGIINYLTNLLILNFSITVNIYPMELTKEIDQTEKLISRLKGDLEASRKYSLEASIDKAHQRLYEISSGDVSPYKVDLIIRVWAETKEELLNNTTLIKSQINMMNAALFWDIKNPVTAKNLFYQSWPGWIFGEYTGYALKEDNRKISDIIPFSAAFKGHLENAEALYDGNAYNIVGVQNYINETPQNAAIFGMSGSGKSATIIDIISQTECFYQFTCIIEEGLSYGIYTQALGEKPIVFKPDGEYIINYLDTQGLPITPMHISSASGLVARMAGISSDESLMKKRVAIIADHINMLYEDTFSDWRQDHENLIPEISRFNLAVEEYIKNEMPETTTFMEGWIEFRDLYKAKNKIAINLYNKISEDEISKFMVTEFDKLRNAAFAWFKTDEYPIHSQLHELVSHSSYDQRADIELKNIEISMRDWCIDGSHGKLFDGHTNVNFNRPIVHFELGEIPESSMDLKTIVVFLINNHVRNHIISLPRSSRKRIIFEEASRLLAVPGGGKIISEAYAQMRKLNTLVYTIVQQYAMFKDSPIRHIVLGNCKQFIMLKQKSRSDLDDLANEITMSDRARKDIMKYPSPTDLPEDQSYAAFMYHFDDQPMPSYGTMKNYCCPEMLYVSSSNPTLFDIRSRQLKKSKNIVESIKEFANQSI